MAESPTSAASGTQTATINTEHSLFASSASGLYSLVVDAVNMVAGDVLELREYQMVLTGGTTRVVTKSILVDAQPADAIITVFDPLGTDLSDSGAVKYTLKQTQGTGRAFPWKVLQF